MRIGVPAEVKNNEYRVALTPAGAHQLVAHGHEVLVQSGAGLGSAIDDDTYREAGARLVAGAADAWSADVVCKVKEPVPSEYGYLRPGLVLFTYLHLAADRPLTEALLESRTTAIAYETVQLPDRSLPLLAPMSEVAGRLAAQVGAYHLMRPVGGRGVLPGGVPGTAPADVVVLGGGTAGRHAIEVAVGMRAHVTVLDVQMDTLRSIDRQFGGHVRTLVSTPYAVEDVVTRADLVVGAVLVAGARAPRLVSNELVALMRTGSVLVDIAIDQGGCFVDSRPTTHDDPTFTVHGSTFYCVANMPGAVPVTSTWALTAVTLPYLVRLADAGVDGAVGGVVDAARADPVVRPGINTLDGALTNTAVGAAHDLPVSRV